MYMHSLSSLKSYVPYLSERKFLILRIHIVKLYPTCLIFSITINTVFTYATQVSRYIVDWQFEPINKCSKFYFLFI